MSDHPQYKEFSSWQKNLYMQHALFQLNLGSKFPSTRTFAWEKFMFRYNQMNPKNYTTHTCAQDNYHLAFIRCLEWFATTISHTIHVWYILYLPTIWLIFMVNVGKYTTHGSYGYNTYIYMHIYMKSPHGSHKVTMSFKKKCDSWTYPQAIASS